MTVASYSDVRERVCRLTQQEKAELLVELANQLRDAGHETKKRSIMEPERLGKRWVGSLRRYGKKRAPAMDKTRLEITEAMRRGELD